MKRIIADRKKCLACRTCELACALAHADAGELFEAIYRQGAQPRIYVRSAGESAAPVQCRHCKKAACIRVCPSGALVRSDEESPVLVIQEKCTACGLCVEACPFDAIRLAPAASDGSTAQTVVLKCDLCAARQAEGLLPACVCSCPVGALLWKEAKG